MPVTTPLCVTLTVLVIPPPDTVTVALRDAPEVFAAAVMVNEPLLLPLAGERVSHAALLVTLQDTLELTVMVLEPPPVAKLWVSGETVSDAGTAPSCVTLMVLVISPPVTVTVALRGVVAVFAAAVMVNVLLLLPLVREVVSHVASSDIVQD